MSIHCGTLSLWLGLKMFKGLDTFGKFSAIFTRAGRGGGGGRRGGVFCLI